MPNNKPLLICLLGSFCITILGSEIFISILSRLSSNGIMAIEIYHKCYNFLLCTALIGLVLFLIFSILLIVNNIILLVHQMYKKNIN